MKRTLIHFDPAFIPQSLLGFIENAIVYDSSCSAAAKVYFLDKQQGFYLKTAPKGTLQKEAAMYRYFHSKDLAPEVIAYESLENDWLLTVKATGEDCTDSLYTADPKRLCDTTAELLRMLHETNYAGCPVPDRTKDYLATAQKNYHSGVYDVTLFPDNWGYATAEEAWRVLEENSKYLQTDTLLHGDYCLPNIMLDNWKFSSFIDLDTAGVGDRHVDLFWATWSLQFNLKTNRYRERFLDAYGRENINEELFRVVAAAEVFG